MKLVTSNDESFAEETIKNAMESYREKADVSAAVDALTKLKGIGPATASLLLAVQDPENVIFFADEAFYWICCDGNRGPIKYNAKEYKDLIARSQSLAKRLDVKAVDVERVSYVLMNEEASSTPRTEAASSTKKQKVALPRKGAKPAIKEKEERASPIKTEAESPTERVAGEKKAMPAKRKQVSVVDDTTTLRRSKRGKKA